jgi:hypothetical protein
MTDGGGIFVALTSCRDEERVEEFLTWYEEVQFRNALAVDGVDEATLYRSTEPGEPGFWLSTRCPVTSQIQRPDFGRLSKTATPRATSPSFWRFASPERSRSRTGRHHQRRARHPVSHVRDRTRFFEGLGTTRPACRYGRHPTLRNDSPNWELFNA